MSDASNQREPAGQPRIVFTGAGAVCAAGASIDAIWEAVLSEKSAIAPIEGWDASRWPAGKAAELIHTGNNALVKDRKLQKFIERTDMFGLYAVGEAIESSGLPAYRQTLPPESVAHFNDRSGAFVGSGSGGGGSDRTNYEFYPVFTAAGGSMVKFGQEFGNLVNPLLLLRHLPNNVLCHLGINHGFKGTNGCITNQCVGGSMAVAEAAAAIRAGEADRAAAVGHDKPVEPEMIFYYNQLGLMSPDMLRPFDAHRCGTILGEGAAAVVLESLDDARARGAQILGEYLGSGCVTEATGICDIRSDGDGLSRAIRLALADADISAAQVGMIVAHGNGTRASDASEAAAIRRVFGEALPPVTAFKWAFGHSLAASGSLDLVLALRALAQGIVPGVPTLRELDPAFGRFPVSSTPQKPRSDIALVSCRGFGGMNVVFLVRAGSAT